MIKYLKNAPKKYLGIVVISIFLILSGLFLFKNQTVKQTLFNAYAEQLVRECRFSRETSICYGTKLDQANQWIGFNRTLKLLKLIQKLDTQTTNCHSIAHKIAQGEVRKNPSQWLDFFKKLEDPYMCFTGFVHGAVEGKKSYDQSLVLNRQTIEQICQDITQVTKQKNPYPCGHAFGHVLLVESNNNLEESINTCSSLAKDLIRGCKDGLFMENIFKTNLAEHGITWPQNDITQSYIEKLEQLCLNFTGDSAQSCWREQSQAYYKLIGPDLNQLKNSCNKAPTKDEKMACYFRSFNFALIDGKFDTAQLATLCTDYNNNQNEQYECYDWAITGLVLASPKFTNLINDVCNASPPSFYAKCWQLKKDRINMYRL